MKDEDGRIKARSPGFCFHFILHPSAFILAFLLAVLFAPCIGSGSTAS